MFYIPVYFKSDNAFKSPSAFISSEKRCLALKTVLADSTGVCVTSAILPNCDLYTTGRGKIRRQPRKLVQRVLVIMNRQFCETVKSQRGLRICSNFCRINRRSKSISQRSNAVAQGDTLYLHDCSATNHATKDVTQGSVV